MGLRGLEGGITAMNKQTLDNLHRLESLSAESLKELQRIISDLRPSHLDDLGLPAALRWYTGQIQDLGTLSIRVEISGEERPLDDAVKITIFRIIQEALNNIIKHAEASQVNVGLKYEERAARIVVRDNGVGFNLDVARLRRSGERASLGLAGMSERAALLGGTVNVHSRPGYGTEVEALIPYQVPSEVSDDHASFAG
jgi:signal transduction histidine kinase